MFKRRATISHIIIEAKPSNLTDFLGKMPQKRQFRDISWIFRGSARYSGAAGSVVSMKLFSPKGLGLWFGDAICKGRAIQKTPILCEIEHF
ncbi:MAG: hypothetical protein JW720_06915 [Sedimentisphaerales bacterium]|nr:hypothetical protein [Sedimentisphaerales bacterium]